MSEQTQEPTMEEILASIRRIISEDEPAEGAPAAEASAPEPESSLEPAAELEAAPEPMPEPETVAKPTAPEVTPTASTPKPQPVVAEEEPLELTDRYEEPAPESVVEVETIGDIEASIAPDPFPVEPEPEPAPAFTATESVVASMAGGTTVEELVRSIVEPQVRTWLDQNLDGLLRDMLREKLNNVFR